MCSCYLTVFRGTFAFQTAMTSARQSCAELKSHYFSDTPNGILAHSSCNTATLSKIFLCNFIIKWHKLVCSVCMYTQTTQIHTHRQTYVVCVCIHTHIHTYIHTYKRMYTHTNTRFHVGTLVEPIPVTTVQKGYCRDVKQALSHTVTVCHYEHSLQWWKVCRTDSLSVKFCMLNNVQLLDNSVYLSVNFSVITGDFKVSVYCNCCWSSHASSWLP